MNKFIAVLTIPLFFLNFSAHAEEYGFIKTAVEAKNKLRQMPPKSIEKTLYCSQMNSLIDRAMPADRSNQSLKADRIVVSKSRRKLYLLSAGAVINEYPVAFGFGSLEGPKSRIGDGRTPEGLYFIDQKKIKSSYTKALHVSYPNDADVEFAQKNKVDPGGSIMIHGLPPKAVDGLDPLLIAQIHPRVDWTQGCIAVEDHQIEEIFSYVDEGITVEICPLEQTNLATPISAVSDSTPDVSEHQDFDLDQR